MEPQSSWQDTQPPSGRSRPWTPLVQFVASHPTGVTKGILLLLLVVITLQNLEPTTLDVLFWSIASFPKLVLILLAMVIGGLVWEMLRRWISR